MPGVANGSACHFERDVTALIRRKKLRRGRFGRRQCLFQRIQDRWLPQCRNIVASVDLIQEEPPCGHIGFADSAFLVDQNSRDGNRFDDAVRHVHDPFVPVPSCYRMQQQG